VVNLEAAPPFPGNQCPAKGFLCVSVSFPAIETGRCSHVNGITVNKTTQTFENAAARGATLSSSYGICNGFELLEHEAVPGREEYRDSENYEIKVRDWDAPGNIKPYIGDLNRARRANAALQQTSNLRFILIDDGNIIGFVKESANQTNSVVVTIALSRGVHEFWFPLGDVQVGMAGDRRHVAAVENLVTGERHAVEWGGIRVRIDPAHDPALLFRCLA
jgi:starch synthase (maltosyl-transferring)